MRLFMIESSLVGGIHRPASWPIREGPRLAFAAGPRFSDSRGSVSSCRHQFKNAPSEVFSRATRVDICEVQKNGRGISIIALRPIRERLSVQAVFPHARSESTI